MYEIVEALLTFTSSTSVIYLSCDSISRYQFTMPVDYIWPLIFTTTKKDCVFVLYYLLTSLVSTTAKNHTSLFSSACFSSHAVWLTHLSFIAALFGQNVGSVCRDRQTYEETLSSEEVFCTGFCVFIHACVCECIDEVHVVFFGSVSLNINSDICQKRKWTLWLSITA